MRVQGASFGEIAEALGVSREQARKLAAAGLQEIVADLKEGGLELMATLVLRTERIFSLIWPEIEEGNLAAVDRGLRAIQILANLLPSGSARTILQQNNLLVGEREIAFHWPDGRMVKIASPGRSDDGGDPDALDGDYEITFEEETGEDSSS